MSWGRHIFLTALLKYSAKSDYVSFYIYTFQLVADYKYMSTKACKGDQFLGDGPP